MAQARKTALILGASRGLGFAIAAEYLKQGWRVIATQRREGKSQLGELRARHEGQLEVENVDIDEDAQVQRLRDKLGSRQLDLLFVNAGVASGGNDRVDELSEEEFARILRTNARSPLRAISALASLVPATGTIAAMSSSLGSVGANETGTWEVYRASKASLNTLLRSYVARNPADPRTYLLLDPGWVRTDMGGQEAMLSVEESIPSLVRVVNAQAGRRGLQYLNYRGETVPW